VTNIEEVEFGLPLGLQLEIHLTNNHYPPVPLDMVPVCVEAIRAINDGDPYEWLDLPKGVSYQGNHLIEAISVAESFHLDGWLEEDAWLAYEGRLLTDREEV